VENDGEGKGQKKSLAVFKELAARVFVPRTNKYNSDFFIGKFLPAFKKVLALRSFNSEVIHKSSDVLHEPKLDSLKKGTMVRPILSLESEVLGLVIFDQAFISESLHFLLGGNEKSTIEIIERELTPLENKTIAQMDASFNVSIREGLKGLRGLKGLESVNLGPNWQSLELSRELSLSHNYFLETFQVKGHLTSEVEIFFRLGTFNI